jgi:putative ABC transport system permease protein
VMLNEAALKTLKFESAEEAINHRIHWQRREYQVIGVFGNYNHLFLKEGFEPIMLSYSPAALGFITLKIENGYYEEAITSARKEVENLFPGKPFEFSFLQSAYNHQYHGIQQFETLTKYFALLAILIACLGLFALSYYASQRRIKEIAVRKVFGAGGLDVMVLLSYSYIRMAIICGVVGSCIAFYTMSKWLANFAFAVSLGAVDFLIPLSIITVIVLITVGYNCLRVSSANPSKSLKHI